MNALASAQGPRLAAVCPLEQACRAGGERGSPGVGAAHPPPARLWPGQARRSLELSLHVEDTGGDTCPLRA